MSKFDKQFMALDDKARKGIETRLGATFDPVGFDKYKEAVARAAEVTRNREAFRAELGADFSPKGFLAYQRAIDKAKLEARSAGLATAGVGGTSGVVAGAEGGVAARLGSSLDEAQSKSSRLFDQIHSSAAGAAMSLGVLSVGVGAIGYESIKSAVNFQKSMEMIHTQAGASTGEVTRMSKAVLALGQTTEQGPEKLSQALFLLESANLRGTTALKALTAAAKGAAVGGADLTDTTDALAGVMVALHEKGGQAASQMAAIDAVVGIGKMHMQDFVDALKSGIVPTATAVGLSFRSMAAGLATMTDAGVPAEMAATKMRTILLMLADEHTMRATDNLAKIGLTSDDLASAMRRPGNGLLDVLQLLHDHMVGLSKVQQTDIFSSLAGGSRSAGTLITLEQQLGRVGVKYDQLGKLTGQFNERVAAESETASHRINVAWSMIQTGFIELGTKALPVLATVLGGIETFVLQIEKGKGAGGEFARIVSGAFNAIKDAVIAVSKPFGGFVNVLKGIGVAIAGLGLVALLGGIVAAVNPVTIAFVAVAAAAALIIDHWKTVGPFLANLWVHVKEIAGPIIQWLVTAWTNASQWVANAWHNASAAVEKVTNAVFPVVASIVEAAVAAVMVAVDILKVGFRLAFNVISTVVKSQIAVVTWALNNVLLPVFGFVMARLGDLKDVFVAVFQVNAKVVATMANIILGVLSTLVHGIGTVLGLMSHLPIIGGAVFGGLSGDANKAGDAIDKLRGSITNMVNSLNGVPAQKTVTVTTMFTSNLSQFLASTFAGLASAESGVLQSIGQSVGGALSSVVAAANRVTGAAGNAAPTMAAAAPTMSAATGALSSAGLLGNGTYYGVNPTTGQRVKHSAAEWAKIYATYNRDHGTHLKPPTPTSAGGIGVGSTSTTVAKVPVDPFAAVPSGTLKQIQAALIANKIQVAQNVGNIKAQHAALSEQMKLDELWLDADKQRVAQIKKALQVAGLTAAKRKTLLADELATLQAIGTVEGNVGSTKQALTALMNAQPHAMPIVYTHDHATTGTVGTRPGEREPAHHMGITKGIGGLHIDTVNVHGSNMTPKQMMNDLYLQLRPYLQAAPY